MSTGWRLNRLGNKSGHSTFFTATWAALAAVFLTQMAPVRSSPMPWALPSNSARPTPEAQGLTRKQNTSTECRIQQVAGVYVEGGGGNNGKIYSYNYGTLPSGSLGFNADGIATNDKFCCYIAGNSTGRTNIKDKQLLLIGWLFDLYFNHNGTGEQNPSGQFWQARPIISHSTSDNGSTVKPSLMLAYPFETTKWQDANPLHSGKMLKFNQTRA